MITKDSGMSILELLISLGLGGLVLTLFLNQLSDVQNLHGIALNHTQLSSIEENTRLAINLNSSLKLTAAKNPKLRACLKDDDNICDTSKTPVNLILSKGRVVTGLYELTGKRCDNGSSCPIKVKTFFTGVCEVSQKECDKVHSILYEYEIQVDGLTTNSGAIRKIIGGKRISDDNQACKTDSTGRTKLANRIGSRNIACLEVPASTRTITGINTGSCNQGTEVLVGFTSTGDLICEAHNLK